ncbi:MAG: ATP-binding protein [Planctomycetaceae bacterium]|nr:ATP-binding protein [Planctomycetaceae bacterium]
MPHIMVVDATPADRRLMANLLADAPQCSVVEAGGVEQALTLARLVPLDLVLADVGADASTEELQGLELLEQLSAEQPLLPIIVVAGRGDEDVAREALQSSAVGYVPKSRLLSDLLPAVEQVLDVAADDRGKMTVQALQTRQSTAFEMENDPGCVAAVVKHVTTQCCRFGITTEQEQVRVAVALEEAILNAMIHGNLEVGSELRERPDDAFRRLIEQRRKEPEFASRRVQLQCEVDTQHARIVIRDEGPGFDIRLLPDPRDADYLLRASGRGVLLMRTFMDEVVYNDAGNEVTLVKRRTAAAPLVSQAPA